MPNKPNVYQIVTEKFIEALKKNIVPWHKPWNTTGTDQWPINRASGKPYRGVNVFLLGIEAHIHGYEANEWLTYKQAAEMGGQVRKGERSTVVTFWKVNKYKKFNESSGEDEDKKGLLLRYYNVFNISQCDGIEPRRVPSRTQPTAAFTVHAQAQALIDGWNGKPHIRHAGNRASYSPQLDIVTMPPQKAFHSPEHYYHTCFHELVHSTGHKTRLNREMGGGMMETDSYAKEELVAEIGATFLSTVAGIDVEAVTDNSVAYVKHWLKALQDDEKLIMSAAGKAQHAVDMITGKTFEESPSDANAAESEDEVLVAA